MIITPQQWERIYRYLGHDKELHASVVRILLYGNEKHGDADASAKENIEHAHMHLMAEGKDHETGEPHLYHAVARLILAIETIIQPPHRGKEEA